MSALLLISMSGLAEAADVTTLSSKDPKLAWKRVDLPGGKPIEYTHGIGSGAFRHPSDPPNVVWTVGDRGPNYSCGDAKDLLGKDLADRCKDAKSGRIYPTPDYTPSIYKIELDPKARTFKVLEIIPLRTKSGKLTTGLPNPQTKASRDTGLDLSGTVLADHPDNLDLEAIVRLADGTFWVGEEMGPSLAHISADGRVLKRLVPADAVDDYKGSEAEIMGTLPAILSKRQANRGIESIAISPDEKTLFAIMQNPLANPNRKAFEHARNARLLAIDRASGKVTGEYVYQLDDPRSFALDPSDKQSDPRISELAALGPDRLLVLERTEGTTKLHEIALAGATNILGTKWDDRATEPSLEQSNDLGPTGVTPVRKTLRFDTARDAKDAPGKIEGMAFLGDGRLVLINDNDFSIRGDVTKVLIVSGAVTADSAVYKK